MDSPLAESFTPRKRKVADESPRKAKNKQRGPPTPNPPLMPFPTPPRSRSRKAELVDPDLSFYDSSSPSLIPSSSSSSIAAAASGRSALPPHLQTLLTLHRAFNVALSLHIATHPPVLPPHSPNATRLKLANLSNLLALREIIERTGGRRFGVTELQRLAWLWTWDGEDPDRKSNIKKEEEDENPFLVSPNADTSASLEVSGLEYLITPTRTLDPMSNRRVYTYGIGIELELRKGETRQLLHGGSEGGIGNHGQGGGMGAVGRWNVAGQEREDVIRDRLNKWVALHGGHEDLPTVDQSIQGLPTPANTRENTRSAIPPIPLLPLPPLPSSTLMPSANLFASSTASASPSPKKPVGLLGGLGGPLELNSTTSSGGLGGAADIGLKSSKVVRPGSVDERRQAMMDRIKARKTQKNPLPTLGSALTSGPQYSLNRADTQEELKRRSTLSRLEGVAEAVWMMFSAPELSSSSITLTPPRSRRKAIPMGEAADIIVKSSKTPISIAEAQTSLALLADLCPFFLKVKLIGRSEWIEMPVQVTMQSSPSLNFGLSSAGGAGGAEGTFPRIHLPAVPSSPTSNRKSASAGGVPTTPTTPGRRSTYVPGIGSGTAPSPSPGSAARVAARELSGLLSPSPSGPSGVAVGAASPGRVRRFGGLREVRERIRRELGE